MPGEAVERAAVEIALQSAEVVEFEDDIDEAEHSAGAASRRTDLGVLFSGMVQYQNADPEAGQALEGFEHFQQRAGIGFAVAGQEGGQGIDDEEVELTRFLKVDGVVDECVPVLRSRPTAKGSRQQFGMRLPRPCRLPRASSSIERRCWKGSRMIVRPSFRRGVMLAVAQP